MHELVARVKVLSEVCTRKVELIDNLVGELAFVLRRQIRGNRQNV